MQATGGGTLLVSTTVANAGGLIQADGTGSVAAFNGAHITGGTLTGSDGGVIQFRGPDTLAGTMTINGTAQLVSSQLMVTNGLNLTVNGDLNVAATSGGIVTTIFSNGAVTLDGSGTLTLAGHGITGTGTGNTLTTGLTIQGLPDIGGFEDINNSGALHDDASGAALVSGLVTNTGTVQVDSGSDLTLQGGEVQTAGTTEVNGILRVNSHGLLLEGGVLDGTGTVNAGVENSGGTVRPGDDPGTLTFGVGSSYLQTSGGTLEIDLLNNSTFGELVDLEATPIAIDLSGALNIVAENGYTPSAHQFLILSAPNGGIVLEPGLTITLPQFAGWNFNVSESADDKSVYLDVSQIGVTTPEPSTVLLVLAALAIGAALHRRRRTA